MPNVGKSTLFNAVTRNRNAEAANYPFCTIDPNVGVVTVPDPRLDVLAEMSKSEKTIPAAIEFVDIAGLVEGASEGAGLGNKFLANIREVDAIVQVVRCFENDDIIHELGSVDPLRDIEIINAELILADHAALEKRKASREKKGQRRRQGSQGRARRDGQAAAPPRRRQARPHLRAQRRGAGADVERIFPAEFQAHHLRLQRFRGRTRCRPGRSRQQPDGGQSPPIRQGHARRRGHRHFRPDRGGDGRPRTRGSEAEFLADMGVDRQRRVVTDQGGLPPPRPEHLPDHRRKGVPRLDHPAGRQSPRRPPASSTPTSSAASSPPRSCTTTTWSGSAPRRPPAKPASSASRARTTR